MKQRGRDGEMELHEAVTPECQDWAEDRSMTALIVTRHSLDKDNEAGRHCCRLGDKAEGDKEGHITQAGRPSVTEKGNKEGTQAIVRYHSDGNQLPVAYVCEMFQKTSSHR